MRLPSPWMMARMGAFVSDTVNADTIEQWKQYAKQWEEYAKQRDEYAKTVQNDFKNACENLMNYIADIKQKYQNIILELSKQPNLNIPYAMPPSGVVGWLGATVDNVLFFESDLNNSANNEKVFYNSIFKKSKIRCINALINFSTIPHNYPLDFKIQYFWSHIQSDFSFVDEKDFHLLPDSITFSHSSGIGWGSAGNWATGNYKLAIFVGEEFATEAKFSVC